MTFHPIRASTPSVSFNMKGAFYVYLETSRRRGLFCVSRRAAALPALRARVRPHHLQRELRRRAHHHRSRSSSWNQRSLHKSSHHPAGARLGRPSRSIRRCASQAVLSHRRAELRCRGRHAGLAAEEVRGQDHPIRAREHGRTRWPCRLGQHDRRQNHSRAAAAFSLRQSVRGLPAESATHRGQRRDAVPVAGHAALPRNHGRPAAEAHATLANRLGQGAKAHRRARLYHGRNELGGDV